MNDKLPGSKTTILGVLALVALVIKTVQDITSGHPVDWNAIAPQFLVAWASIHSADANPNTMIPGAGMTKMFMTIMVILLIPSMVGCSRLIYSERHADGTVTSFKATTFFDNNKLSKLAVARKNGEKSSQGLSLGQVENDVNTEAIKSAGDLVKEMTSAAVSGAVQGAAKAVKP